MPTQPVTINGKGYTFINTIPQASTTKKIRVCASNVLLISIYFLQRILHAL